MVNTERRKRWVQQLDLEKFLMSGGWLTGLNRNLQDVEMHRCGIHMAKEDGIGSCRKWKEVEGITLKASLHW